MFSTCVVIKNAQLAFCATLSLSRSMDRACVVFWVVNRSCGPLYVRKKAAKDGFYLCVSLLLSIPKYGHGLI